MRFTNVLVPVDFSELSALALRYAGLLARCGRLEITVAHAHSFSAPAYFTGSRLEELSRQFRESFAEAEAALRDFAAANLGPELARAAAYRIVEAPPATGIRRMAGESRADVIVMGTHGRGGVNRLMLGSVVERVLRETDIPVLTVRGETSGTPPPPRQILCPVNDTPAAREALSAAAALAHCFGGAVTVLHASEPGSPHGIDNLCAWVPQELRRQCDIRELAREGNAAREAVAYARESGSDLMVVGAEHRRFFDATVLGSTVARIVRHAPCPVMTVPARVT